jgi:hypothetical protein
LATGADDEEELSEKVVKMAMEILRLHCMWDIEQLLTAADDGEASSTLDAVVARCDAVFEQLFALEGASATVRSRAFSTVMDLNLMYANLAKKKSGVPYEVPEAAIVKWFEHDIGPPTPHHALAAFAPVRLRARLCVIVAGLPPTRPLADH